VTYYNVDITMKRIEHATPESPIAVFRADVQSMVDSVFASTVVSQQKIRSNDPKLIGVFDRNSNPAVVRGKLQRAANRRPGQ
jgi:hypothetical protein